MITEIVTPLNDIFMAFLNNEIIVGIRNGGFTVLIIQLHTIHSERTIVVNIMDY